MSSVNHDLYEKDFYAWSLKTAELIRQKKFEDIDLEHTAEEIESMGRGEKNQLISHLAILVAHLLKWQYQPERRGTSWQKTIKYQRSRIPSLIEKSPSLKYEIDKTFKEAYIEATRIAAAEMITLEAVFPEVCPFSMEQALDNDFFPE